MSNTAKDFIDKISLSVSDFCEGSDPFDDMAVLLLFRPEVSLTSLPLDRSSFETVKRAVFTAAGETKETRRALLACDEALTNIIRYSEATDVGYSCSEHNGILKVVFSDNGTEFDPTKARIEDKDFEFLEEGGMGLGIMKQTSESLRYERRLGRNILTLDFKA